ncbi:MAG TPA: polysaccharide biosynthesis/export family protein [Candidatus Eisenbacteria bacterium]|nr:polysaccharide biosynthesis/export family protein [Candidatus Eisenbacteria bacterium]
MGRFASRFLQWVLLLAIVSNLAMGQSPSASAQAATPAAPAENPHKTTPGANADSYVIGAEDVISVYVWKEPDMSKTVPVRPDGMISLPLVGEVKAAGNTPVQLQGILAEAMKKMITDPQVTVVVEKIGSLNFNIVGEVNHPGYFPLTRRMTVLDAIALAGGFKDFAKTKKVYVLRTGANGTQERLPFNYKDVIAGKNPQQNIELQPRDTIVVP